MPKGVRMHNGPGHRWGGASRRQKGSEAKCAGAVIVARAHPQVLGEAPIAPKKKGRKKGLKRVGAGHHRKEVLWEKPPACGKGRKSTQDQGSLSGVEGTTFWGRSLQSKKRAGRGAQAQ